MRILTVGNMYPPHHLGGYEIVWRDTVRHLRDAGHQVRVLTTDHRRDAVGEGDDPDVHRELRWYWRDHEFPSLTARGRLSLERHNAAVLERHLREHRAELVSWWAMGGMSLSLIERVRRRGLAANAVVLDDWMLYGPRVDGWIRAFASRPLLRPPAAALTGIPTGVDLRAVGPALFPSETTRRRALEAVPLPDTEVFPLGVDRGLFAAAPERDWSWRLLYAGRIDARKGIVLAVEALVELPAEATLTIAGSGDDAHLAELRELAATRGLASRVDFTARPREALRALYTEADAVLFPVIWEEPWGLVPLEAMSVGRPVVASGRGGSGEYLRDRENSLLFDPDEGPAGLAAAVRELAGDPRLRSVLREGGLETAEGFSEERWNRAVEGLCERARAAAGRADGGEPSGASRPAGPRTGRG